MSLTEPGIAEDVVTAVARALKELGYAPPSPPRAAGTVVPGRSADELFDHAAEYLLDQALGLNLALRVPIGSLGPIDYGLTTSATLREALELVVRYYGIATQRVKLELVDEPPHARLIGHRQPGITHSRHWIEFAFGVIAMRIRQSIGRPEQPFERVAFLHPPPSRTDVHDEFFGTRVEFAATSEFLQFPSELLDIPLQTASQPLAELLRRRMEELAPAMATTDAYLDRVRRTLGAMLDEGVTELAELARRLDESTRSVQRALKERHSSHTQLLDELRRARAIELLDQGLRVADVASRLGFSEPSAFFRAYRRWTGSSPKGSRSPSAEA